MAAKNGVLHNRTLLIIGFAESISGIGDWITMMAVFALLVFRGGGGVTESSGVFLAGLVPALVASPLSGWLCDRLDRKWLMIANQLISGLVVSGLIFIEQPGLIYVLLALQAVAYSVMLPARHAVVPDIVAHDDLTRANAFLQQLSGFIKMGAPMLAGLILGIMGPRRAIILDVVSFCLAALILSRLPSLPPRKAVKTLISKAGSIETGPPQPSVRNVLKSIPQLRILFFSAFMSIIVVVGFDVLASVYVRDVLRQDERFFGLLIGLVGFGTLLATILLMTRKEAKNSWRDLGLGILLLAAIPFSLFLASHIENHELGKYLVLGFTLIGGIGNGLLTVQIGTLLQLLTPASVLGQIGGIFQSTTVAGQLVGILLAPMLVPGFISMNRYFAISCGVLVLLAAALLTQLQGSLRATGPGVQNGYSK